MTARLRWLPILLLATILTAGCASMPDAADRSQQDPAASPTPPAPSEVDARPDRPLPHPLTAADGFTPAVDAGTRTRTGEPGNAYWTQDVRYDLDATVLPQEKRVEATAVIEYTNNSPDALSRLFFELAQNLHAEGVERNTISEVTGGIQLRSVAINGTEVSEGQGMRQEGNDPHYLVRNTTLLIAPTDPLASGESVTIEIEYSFTIPQAGASGRMGYDGDDLVFIAYWYPQMTVYDDVTGWMTDPFLGRAEFYADFGDYDIAITAPSEWIVQSTGALQNPGDVLTDDALPRYNRAVTSDEPVRIASPNERVTATGDDGALTWRYRAERVRDVAFSLTKGYWEAARTEAGDVDGDGTPDSTQIHTFWRESAPKWAEVTKYQQHAITYFAEYTGIAYPWPHMSAVEGGGIIGGGMEFPMITIMGDYNNRSARMLYAVTAHELAHMWVPMMVNTNERRYSWMDEGTTSFNENMARRDYFDDSDAIASDRQDYIDFVLRGGEAPIMRWSNYHYSGASFGIASYRKPATLLAALRGVLGDDTFNEAYRAFLADWQYRHPYPTDFFNTFERVSGRDLDWFWSSFYYETWTLDHAISSVTRRGDRLEVTVEDRGRAFMPVHLTVTMDDGDVVEGRIPVDVWLRGRTTATTTLNVDASAVQSVEIDAEQHFPDVDRTNNTWTPAN
jgi:hypothetical protein